MHIDNELYWVKDENRYRTNTPKTQIIIATSLRKDSNHILRYQHKEFGKTKKWCTYTITRDGSVYQHYDPKKHTDFLDVKEGDKQSISIVMENMGYLVKVDTGEFLNWIGEKCDEENVVEKSWRGYKYWEKITDEQIESCAELCKQISEDFGIRKKVIDFQHYHNQIHKFKGIVFRSNYLEDCSDINPLVDIEKLKVLIEENIKV